MECLPLLEALFTPFYHIIIAPFAHHPFMLKALIGCAALAIGCGSVGTFLVLRRMSLVADALSHGLFPGVSLAFLLWGFQIAYLSIAGAITGVMLALIAYYVTRTRNMPKDSTFAVLVLFSMASGLFILSTFGSYTDVMHILVGNILVLSRANLQWLALVGTGTLITLALIYRPLVLQAFDPQFFRIVYPRGGWIEPLFLTLLTLNMVCAFQALGSLMALGLLLLPAIAARRWASHIWSMCTLSTVLALLSGLIGLLLSYHTGLPTGPLIVLSGVAFYLISLIHCPKLTKSLLFASMTIILVTLGITYRSVQNATIRPQVVVSFTILKDFVHQIAGHNLRVKSLAGSNQDPHTFEPSPQDILDLEQADLVIINGLHLENHWLDRFLSHNKNISVVRASKTCSPLFYAEQSQKVPDPHAWNDVQNARRYVHVILDALCARWPKLEALFRFRAQIFDQKLAALDKWVHNQIKMLPPKQRCALTTHDAFNYFGKAYGFLFLSPLGASTDSEPSAQKVALLIEEARARNIKGIFFENMVSQNLINTLAEEAGLTVGGTLYSDALSEPDGPAPHYVDMMRHNVRALLAPARAHKP
jgi:zinc/manganese transport system permease protein